MGVNGTLFHKENEPERGIPIEVISVKAFAPEKAESFVEGHGRGVCDFCFKGNLNVLMRWGFSGK